MVEPDTVFQRTDAGRFEIKTKSAGLTQSERRVLIMLDGVTGYTALPAKLPGLDASRLQRAIHKLLMLDLISPVLLRMPNQRAERVDQEVAERFLRQEELDPITIVCFDTVGDVDSDAPIVSAAPVKTETTGAAAVDLAEWTVSRPQLDPAPGALANATAVAAPAPAAGEIPIETAAIVFQPEPEPLMPRSLTLAHPTTLFQGSILFLRENGWQSAMIITGVVLIVAFI